MARAVGGHTTASMSVSRAGNAVETLELEFGEAR